MCTSKAIALLVVVTLGVVLDAEAQYFGRNKVQYEKFDFEVLSTEHFDIYFYPEEEAAVQLASRMAERWYSRLSRVLRHELTGRQPLILYAAHPHFQQTTALPGEIGEGTGGVTEMFKRRIVLPFAGGLAETDHVLGHELVHAFQFDLGRRRDADGNAIGPAVAALPLWFIEGMAEYLSLGPVDAHTAMWIRDAAARDRMPRVRDLDNPDFFPYRYGHAFWAYVAGRWDDDAVGDMLRATGPQGDIEAAMRGVLGVDEETFTRDWHEATRRTYAPFFETTRRPESFAKPLITRDGSGGELNVAPSLSPDGRRLVFLSERSLLSIDMYVADAVTGRVLRKIVETAGDAHFDSLQFLSSAGDWSPDNRRFTFAALTKGQPVIVMVDIDSGEREQEHALPELDEAFNPAWSPDGRQIAFSAMKGGVLDLYLLDIGTGSVRQLTNDPYADMDPEWSPDGLEIAWVTDRFSSNVQTLEFGNYRIGRLNVRTGTVRALAGFETGRNSNPEFSADGRWLYFIATPDGISNVYRAAIGTSGITRVTNVLSGVSGITPLTPALSVAAKAPRLTFTAFENNQYNIYTTESAAQLTGRGQTRANGAILPPSSRQPSIVAQLLEAPSVGLPPPRAYPREEYRPRLSLDAIGQPTVGVGADRFGAYAAGGLSLLWSDVLGFHTLATTLQLSSRFQEIGGGIGYLNRRSRWNWGVIGEQTPYVTGSFASGFAVVEGIPVLVEQTHRITQINRGASGVLQYPFSRASRVEFTSGFRQIVFDRRLETRFFSLATGGLLDETVEDLPRPDALNLSESSAALVYDTSVFGATSPILGQRYRLEYSQVAGSLLFSGALVDYRRYFMPARPFTVALRGLHYGRYGRDGEDARLSPLFLGYPSLVRGYEIQSLDASECVAATASTCSVFDQLVGSRIVVASAELRVPLFGLFSRRTFYGPLPIELALFGDAGAAWTSSVKPRFFGGDRDWVRSLGAAIRVNALGFAVIELDYVRPLDRPRRGWVWQVNLTPGF